MPDPGDDLDLWPLNWPFIRNLEIEIEWSTSPDTGFWNNPDDEVLEAAWIWESKLNVTKGWNLLKISLETVEAKIPVCCWGCATTWWHSKIFTLRWFYRLDRGDL